MEGKLVRDRLLEMMNEVTPDNTLANLPSNHQEAITAVFMAYARQIWEDIRSEGDDEEHNLASIAAGLLRCFTAGHNWVKEHSALW